MDTRLQHPRRGRWGLHPGGRLRRRHHRCRSSAEVVDDAVLDLGLAGERICRGCVPPAGGLRWWCWPGRAGVCRHTGTQRGPGRRLRPSPLNRRIVDLRDPALQARQGDRAAPPSAASEAMAVRFHLQVEIGRDWPFRSCWGAYDAVFRGDGEGPRPPGGLPGEDQSGDQPSAPSIT